VSDIEPATPRGNVTKKAAAKSASPGRGVSRSAASGRYVTEKAARKVRTAGLSGMKSKAPKREKVYERVIELGYEKPRRKRSREENEKLVAAAKALVVELRNDQKTLPNGI
jgi:hypothetical protein